MSKPINAWKGEFADEVMEFDATEMLPVRRIRFLRSTDQVAES